MAFLRRNKYQDEVFDEMSQEYLNKKKEHIKHNNAIQGSLVTHLVKTRGSNGHVHFPHTKMGEAFKLALQHKGVKLSKQALSM